MKTVLLVIIFTVWCQIVKSCDICGCSVSGNYFGIMPMYKKHFVGLRSHWRKFRIFQDSEQRSTETSYTAELWSKIAIGKKLQIFGFIPYHSITKSSESYGVEKVQGIGDVSLMIGYQMFSIFDSTRNVTHSGIVTVGIKAPTGDYKFVGNAGYILPGFQAGTGSWDVPLAFIYMLKGKKFGVNCEANYLFTNENLYDYQFGNKFSTALRFFYWKFRYSFSVLPNLGISYENYQKDIKFDRKVKESGGFMFNAIAGLDMYFKVFSVGINSYIPVVQHIGNESIKSNPRLLLNLIYLF